LRGGDGVGEFLKGGEQGLVLGREVAEVLFALFEHLVHAVEEDVVIVAEALLGCIEMAGGFRCEAGLGAEGGDGFLE
jgi:hypothetical protein